MSEPIFECANIPVAVASKALKVDCQTVRLLLQSGAVNWGIAYHRTPKSRQYSYLIYPKKFYEETGFLYKGGYIRVNILKRYRLKKQQKELMRKYAIMEQLQREHNEDEYFYKYTQREMDALDEQAEHIRGILEGRLLE